MRLFVCSLAGLLFGACESSPSSMNGVCGSLGDTQRVTSGSDVGHADPAGARAASQARAGRIANLSIVRRAPDARHAVRVGDYLLANDKISVYIEGARPSDGYTPYGGEILAIETYDPNGQPRGTSEYGETLLAISGQIVAPEKVTVIADGSDGGPAIVRSEGVLRPLAFLESFAALFGDMYPLPAAVDYVLLPGEARVKIALHLVNTRAAPIDLAGGEVFGFFHSYRGQTFSDANGFGSLDGSSPGVLAWDAGTSAFAFRLRGGQTEKYLLSQAGVELFLGSGTILPPCAETVLDYAELVAGDSLDGVIDTIRTLDGKPAARAVVVEVKDGSGTPLVGAYVHATGADGKYLTRAIAGSDGKASLHVLGAVTLDATAPGYASPPSLALADGAATASFAFGVTGTIDVQAKEAGTLADLPVRVIVIPAVAATASPAIFGVSDEAFGRSHQIFALTGHARVVVPAGMHRVVVSRGYEYELVDQTVDVAAGATVSLTPQLAHSVDTTGAMCADFHIHSYYSVDAPDPTVDKVKSALAEGLDIPISSEHEYVIDFQPIIETLGMTKWAHGLSSEELTTFTYGHFGVVPRTPNLDAPNRGAVDWIGKQPGEVFSIVRALPEQPALIVNHPYSTSFQGYLVSASFDLATATGDPMLYSDNFDAIEVCNDSDVEENRSGSIAAWFSLLNHGKRVFAVGSSDSHRFRTNPVGYPRTCLALGHDDPQKVTANAVRDAVKGGQAIITGGLYLTVEGPGGVRPGGTIASVPTSGKLAFDIVVQAPSFIDAKELEVIVDGVSVQTLALVPSVVPGPAKRWEAPVEIDVPQSAAPGGFHWVVFHASSAQDLAPMNPARHPFALSNPIFF